MPFLGDAELCVERLEAALAGGATRIQLADRELERGALPAQLLAPLAGLLGQLRQWYARSPELAFVLEVADAASSALGERPNLDFALAAIARVLKLPAGAPLTLFGIGRTIGWIGHAIEQYATGQLIRPRAKYVGVAPS